MRLMTRKRNLKRITEEAIERHPVPVFGIDYRVRIVYTNVEFAQLDVEDRMIKISLPLKQKELNNERILDLAIDKMYQEIAIVEIERSMEKMRKLLGFAPEDYEIRKIYKDLAKCENGKIIINPELIQYDRKIIDYVVLHQYCHLKYKSHCKGFWQLLEKYEPEFELYERIIKEID